MFMSVRDYIVSKSQARLIEVAGTAGASGALVPLSVARVALIIPPSNTIAALKNTALSSASDGFLAWGPTAGPFTVSLFDSGQWCQQPWFAWWTVTGNAAVIEVTYPDQAELWRLLKDGALS